MSSYCDYCLSHPEDSLNCDYHDHLYGFPIASDEGLFERLVLEINQAGLSWVTILRKADNFRLAYAGFNLDRVANFTDDDRQRLLADAGIIRNRKKVEAAIENAKRLQVLRSEYGSFKGWLDNHHQLDLDGWTQLFKKTFVFTGREIVNEFLMSAGYLKGAHDETCPVYHEITGLKPAWMSNPLLKA